MAGVWLWEETPLGTPQGALKVKGGSGASGQAGGAGLRGRGQQGTRDVRSFLQRGDDDPTGPTGHGVGARTTERRTGPVPAGEAREPFPLPQAKACVLLQDTHWATPSLAPGSS